MKWLAVALALLMATGAARAGEISPRAERLRTFLESLRVESRWLPRAHVDWYTGEPDGKPLRNPQRSTHCSAFAASVCCRSGIALPCPPDYSLLRLANAQYDWLLRESAGHGWTRLSGGIEAQKAANRGALVVAVCRGADDSRPGHIAIVLPGEKPAVQIAAEGPDVMQAGAENYRSVALARGFRHHRDPLANVVYFSHVWDAGW